MRRWLMGGCWSCRGGVDIPRLISGLLLDDIGPTWSRPTLGGSSRLCRRRSHLSLRSASRLMLVGMNGMQRNIPIIYTFSKQIPPEHSFFWRRDYVTTRLLGNYSFPISLQLGSYQCYKVSRPYLNTNLSK